MALPDYGKLQEQVITKLKSNATLIAALAGGLASSITYAKPNIGRTFPCLTVRDIVAGPSQAQHELPTASLLLTCQIDLWGESQNVRSIQSLVDDVLENSMVAGGMDVATFWKVLDVDTHGNWRTVDVPAEIAGSTPIEQRSKDFVIHGVALTSGT